MNRQIMATCLILLFSGSFLLASGEQYRSGQVLVRFADVDGESLSLNQKSSILNSRVTGSTLKKTYQLVPGLSLVQLPQGVTVPDATSSFLSSPLILYAEPVYQRRLAVIPNDPNFPQLWAMNNTGQTGGTVDADIDAPEAWDIHTGNASIIVAVVDTGIDYNHPDLIDNMWINEIELIGLVEYDDDGNGYVDDIYGWDAAGASYADPVDYDGDPNDSVYHGTHVAGTIGAVGNNAVGVTGVCWDVRLMAVKIFSDDYDIYSYTDDALEIAGIEYAVLNGANVINASWGGYGYSQALYDMIAAARDAGVLFVAGAGNDSIDNDILPFYPASYDLENIISVLATDHDDQIAVFSNYGETTVDIGAPGVDILSTFPTYETNDMNLIPYDVNYETISGTSMATPHVAGAAALGWSLIPELDYQIVRDAILSSADPLVSLNGLCATGGRLNLESMLLAYNTKVLNKNTGLMYDRIQQAIDAPQTLSGHTLIVHRGESFVRRIYYFETIDFRNKNLVIRSGDVDNPLDETIYPEGVIISGRFRNTHTVTIDGGQDSSTVLKGFTITEGYATGVTIQDKSGGGIYCEDSSPTISDCIITNNSALRDGGGIHCEDSGDPDIINCTISNNIAVGNDGGGIYCFDSSPSIINCLIVHNRANRDGGGIYFNGTLSPYQPTVRNCTIADNSVNIVDGHGGAVYCYWKIDPDITDCIISGNPGYAIYEEDTDSDPTVSYCLFYENVDGDYYDADTLSIKTGAGQVNSLPEASDNIAGDPLYVSGRLGDYYLSQIAAGQMEDSPALDVGSDTAANLGMDIYSTRTDNVADDGIVDIGFHYNDPRAPVMFTLWTYVYPEGAGSIEPVDGVPHVYTQYRHVMLEASVDGDSPYQFKAWYGTDDDSRIDVNEDGDPYNTQYNIVTMDSDKSVMAEFETRLVSLSVIIVTSNGTYELSPEPDDPRRDLYKRGREVTITVLPMNPSHRITWLGTDDDISRQFSNTVTMTEDKEVYIWLEEARTLIVSGGGVPGAYTEIEEALDDSVDGDTIVVHEGEWQWTWPHGAWMIMGKDITLRSVNPDDPDVVASTVFLNRITMESVSRDMVIAGITFRDATYLGGTSNFQADDANCDGGPGGSVFGGALQIGSLNRSIVLYPELFTVLEASPTVVNCIFENLTLWGGDGQDTPCGCPDIDADGGWGGAAYGGAVYIGPGCNPVFKNCIMRNNSVIGGDGGNGCGHGGSWGDPDVDYGEYGWEWFVGPFDEEWKYSGHGGAAYCDVGSNPEFIDCIFQDNVAEGGSSGLSQDYGWPHWRIDSYGGAVYCAAASEPNFINCQFIDNIVDPNGLEPLWGWKPGTNEDVFIADKYFGFGGAVAIEGKIETFEGVPAEYGESKVYFENCTFSGNSADNGNGGGLHCQLGQESGSVVLIKEGTFEGNTAYHGGAVYSVNGKTQVLESTFSGNTATSQAGEGGAIFVFDGDLEIADSTIIANEAVASGGGLFTSDSNGVIWNCLITDNTSGRDGGGVSANIYSDCNIINTTIADNVGGKFGGGLFCGYNSYTHIIDSIIWGNFSVDGHQIAIESDDEYYPEPSVVEISYSDVGPRYALGELIEEDGGGGGSGSKLIEGQTINDQIDSSGWAETVVTLSDPAILKENADWDSPEWVEQYQEEISKRQQAVLSQLTAGEFTLRYRYDNVAAFSGLVTSQGLSKLMANLQVKHIEPVRHFYRMLRQAIPLANALTARQEYDGTGVAIAIVDSGIDYRHPRLGGGGFPNDKVIGGYDVAEGDDDPIPFGDDAHGTCCAGIAAGDLDNIGDYIGGVAFNAKLYAVKATLDDSNEFAEDTVLAAWDWCLTHRLDDPDNPILVVSNSLGGVGFSDNAAQADLAMPALAMMAENLTDAGITVLAASGNEYLAGLGISFPAALSDVVSVGAVYDINDQVTPYSNTALILDILAPGDPIYTTDIVAAAGYDAGDYFPTFNGTSAACPFAAGVVASLQSAAMETMGIRLTPSQVRTVLAASGNPVTDTKIAITKPRVNLGNAIDSLFSGPIYIGENSEIRYGWWNSDTMTWLPASHNLAINDDPLFVNGYYLSQIAAGQDVDSKCVDAGSTDAHTAGKYRHTTRTDLVVEDLDSAVDMGYHYVRTTEFRGDLNFDGQVNMGDYARLIRHWLEVGCEFPDWCHGTDLNMDGTVNNKDYAVFADNYGKKETVPPEPNPMTWELYPTSQPGANWAKMTATQAIDNYGGTIEYYIQRTNGVGVPDEHFRDWDPDRTFTDEGLVVNQKYGYRVKARDQRSNETGWSVIGYVTVGEQTPPYEPSNLSAQAVSETQINLSWTDGSYDELGFKIERRTGAQPFAQIDTVDADITTYQDTGLQHSTTYTYRVRAWNAGGNSPYSNEASATTFIVIEPNEPNMIIGDVDPNSTQYTDGTYWYHIVAGEIIDLADGVPLWFKFECMSEQVFSSDWIDSTDVFPMELPHPINPGFPPVVITLADTIVSYTIAVKEGGAFGWALDWRICASYEADGSYPSCSEVIMIPPD